MTAALRFVDYGFSYASGDRPALEHVTLDLPAARVVSVIGAQGSGKTTLLRAAAGLLGEIYLGTQTGSLTAEANVRAAAFFDGYVQVTLAVETVREEIALPLIAAGLRRADRDRRVLEVAHELGIAHLVDRRVTALSGGEEKLVGIAAALVQDRPVFVFDEPFEQLDVAHLAAVIRAIKLRARGGSLVLVATGALDIAINIAQSAVVRSSGEWTLTDAPTYADVSSAAAIGESPVMTFLERHHAERSGVRRFRDAARRVS